MLVDQYNIEKVYETSFNEENFVQYLSSICGGKSKATAQCISKTVTSFFTYKEYQQKTPLAIILSKVNLRSYITHIQVTRKYAGTTIADKLCHLKHAIDFLSEGTSSTKQYLRVQEALRYIDNIKRTLNKTIIKDQRVENTKLSSVQVYMHRVLAILSLLQNYSADKHSRASRGVLK